MVMTRCVGEGASGATMGDGRPLSVRGVPPAGGGQGRGGVQARGGYPCKPRPRWGVIWPLEEPLPAVRQGPWPAPAAPAGPRRTPWAEEGLVGMANTPKGLESEMMSGSSWGHGAPGHIMRGLRVHFMEEDPGPKPGHAQPVAQAGK